MFSFSFRRNNNLTDIYWEKNDCYESHHDTIKAEWNEFQNWVENPLMTWNTLVMFGLSFVVKILSVTTSMIDTEDEIVKKQQMPRSQTYLKRFGMPVVDSFTGICNICRVKVAKSTRHCRLNMTTIEYLNRKPVYMDDYVSENDDNDHRFMRFMTQKIRRTWMRVVRKGYHKVKNTKDDTQVDMEEFFATRTIRPTIINEQEIDYDDDMGLDMTFLQQPNTSKIAKLLDISEQEVRQQQSKVSHK
ncbi:hypothetical protein G6F57_011758 [Rhizopus arrhizus]|uniref:Uncharacterized protein n=1 Tax=Rhizopus oryzae TaxID=64495 RepID=A0A9P6XFB4_RHIOR|nr:hypothetical protein G6F23_008793 [Rhizopus arrhizus]KAG1411010.1 hypothetical protein G6F58_008797 [Rhizopus delemar]KAG0783302.1 hypothetical protein G6F21_010616 [Rhizopus arrhizus]KAG0818128.1 hypothetical protein G6F20_001822 [Rhizopus arrhizus]KAG0822071.1 hypothetical protein G6F19_011583 [Rhizopus arrhizus]